MKFRNIFPLLVLLGVGLFTLTAAPAHAEIDAKAKMVHSFLVNSTADLTDLKPGDGKCKTAANTCTLRAAIQEGNAKTGLVIVYLPTGVYGLEIGGSDDNAKQGDLDIRATTYILGAGMETTIIDGNYLDRVFHVVDAQAELTLKDLTIRKGSAGSGVGGAIWNDGGKLGLWATVIRDSSADQGGGIYNSGSLYMYFSTLDNNVAFKGGGGIFNTGDAEISGLIAVSVLRNGAGTHGGGIWNQANSLVIEDSTIALNYANQNGGGFYNTTTQQTPNNVQIMYATIAENIADADSKGGGGGGGIVEIGDRQVHLAATLIANNHDFTSPQTESTEDCYGQYLSEGHNLLGISDGCTVLQNGVNSDLVGNAQTPLNPKLLALKNYGGPTETLALDSASPAIDAGQTSYCGDDNQVAFDQRGFRRNDSGNCDIGATELDSACTNPLITDAFSPRFKQKLATNNVNFTWVPAICATTYHLTVRQKSNKGKVVLDVNNIGSTAYAATLSKGKKYAWSIQACNQAGRSTEVFYIFKIKK